ncbi:hypothetical protein M9Y10_027366 [Tritrichomonas musculus]|uniref:Ankyrin repeat protein n=1 Tax=Tritrichomonas musculus TaxID=1915356 RepID=A0ABR2H4S7_9EUKA
MDSSSQAQALTYLLQNSDFAGLSSRPDLIPLFNTQITGIFKNDKISITNPYPIQLAVLTNDQAIVNLLLSSRADPNLYDRNTNTPPALHIAVLLNQIPVIQMLFSAGANIEIYNQQNLTPLHAALLYSDISTFQALLVLGANVNATNPSGETVLQVATSHQKAAHVQLILSMAQVPMYQQQQQAYADKEQFNALQNRVTNLEMVLSRVLNELPGNYNENCGMCHMCHTKEGNVICPVCHQPFCHYDWLNHVMIGCQNVQ